MVGADLRVPALEPRDRATELQVAVDVLVQAPVVVVGPPGRVVRQAEPDTSGVGDRRPAAGDPAVADDELAAIVAPDPAQLRDVAALLAARLLVPVSVAWLAAGHARGPVELADRRVAAGEPFDPAAVLPVDAAVDADAELVVGKPFGGIVAPAEHRAHRLYTGAGAAGDPAVI